MQRKTIALGGDHAGFAYKSEIGQWLLREGYAVVDMGTHSEDSVDYPDFVHPLAESVSSGKSQEGLLFCGSGNGVAMTANKHQEIRAAIAWNADLASLARQHNNANVLAIPCRFVDLETAIEMVKVFLTTEFEGGRHARRVDKIAFC